MTYDNFNFTNNEIVYMKDLNVPQDESKRVIVTIVGCATIPTAVIGRNYIVHAPHLKSDIYPFEYVSVPEILLEKINIFDSVISDVEK